MTRDRLILRRAIRDYILACVRLSTWQYIAKAMEGKR